MKWEEKMYKTVVLNYSPDAAKMASLIEERANRMEKEGFELVSCTVMPSAKGILVFREKNSSEKE